MAEREPNLQLLYDIARSRLDIQLNSLDSLDAKLGLLLSVGAAVLTVAAAVVSIEHARWSVWTVVGLAGSIGTFIALSFWTINSLRSQRWGIGPQITPIAATLRRSGEREAMRLAINTLRELFAENTAAYETKVSAVLLAAIALALETLTALGALVSLAGR